LTKGLKVLPNKVFRFIQQALTITNLRNRLESLHWIKVDQKVIYRASNFPKR
jgi:hypothetical protein